jgi:excisionase family DNA binding protein
MPATYLTPGEVAQRLGISRPMVIRYMDEGRIPCVTIAGRRVIAERHAKKPQPLKPGPKRAE